MYRSILILVLCFFNLTSVNGSIIFIDLLAEGNNDGSSWQNAYTNLQSGLIDAEYGDSIWVVSGTYFPDLNTGDRQLYFQLKSGVALLGGFIGNESFASQRNWSDNPTILSGEIGDPTSLLDNSYTVLYTEACDSTTIIDGFIIEHGQANDQIIGTIPDQSTAGGGLFIDSGGANQNAAPHINNCMFRHNHGGAGGGAIFYTGLENGSVSVFINSCTFQDNTTSLAFGLGGAIFKTGGNTNTTSYIHNSSFINNRARDGGAVFFINDESSPSKLDINNCHFTNNLGFFTAGAIFYRDGISSNVSFLNIRNSSFQYNTTERSGGAVSLQSKNNKSTSFTNCSFQYNNAGFGNSDDTGPREGGAIHLTYVGSPLEPPNNPTLIQNCEFINNLTDYGGAVYVEDINLKAINCLFTGNWVNQNGGVIYANRSYIFPSKIDIIGSTITRNQANQTGASFYCNDSGVLLYPGENELSIQNCILWDNQAQESEAKVVLGTTTFNLDHSIIDLEDCSSLVESIFEPNNYTINCTPSVLFNVDPLFSDTSTLDYTLSPCSPAINTGINSVYDSLEIDYDINNNVRIISSLADIGAFESSLSLEDSIIINGVSCPEFSDGSVILSPNGCPPFGFTWENTDTTGHQLNNLMAGIYSLTISDAVNQIGIYDFTIDVPSSLDIEVSINDEILNDGEITINNIIGGQAPYFYNWSTGDTSQMISGLSSGNYHLTITDYNNCQYYFSFPIDFLDNLDESMAEPFSFNVYPNPLLSTDGLFYKYRNNNNLKTKWVIFSPTGSTIYSIILESNITNRINANHFAPGVYFWVLIQENYIIKYDKLVIH